MITWFVVDLLYNEAVAVTLNQIRISALALTEQLDDFVINIVYGNAVHINLPNINSFLTQHLLILSS